MSTLFRVEEAHEILRDPGGHFHHWTILAGVLEQGTLRLRDVLAVPRVGGGFWVGHVIGFQRFRERFGESVNSEHEAGRVLGVAISAVAPAQGTVARGHARVVDVSEARVLLAELRVIEPSALDHCNDCRNVRNLDQPG